METIGTELIKYKEEIESMLTAVLKLNGKKGYVFACFIYMRLLNSLVLIYPLENKLSDCDYDDPNYLAFEVIKLIFHTYITDFNLNFKLCNNQEYYYTLGLGKILSLERHKSKLAHTNC